MQDHNLLSSDERNHGFSSVVLSENPNQSQITDEFADSLERERKRRERWPGDGPAQMVALAKLFPTMRGVPGTDPWNVDDLIAWMNTGAPTSGSWWAAMFLLGVWNPSTNWREVGLKLKRGNKGRFDLYHAMGAWDHKHIRAMQEWVANPFWP